jgi:hypothetical protein
MERRACRVERRSVRTTRRSDRMELRFGDGSGSRIRATGAQFNVTNVKMAA